MPSNPRIPKSIAVRCANAHSGSTLYARNRTTGEEIKEITSSEKCIINLKNFTSGVTTGDVIELKVFGAYFGQSDMTVTSGESQEVTMTLAASSTTNAPGISF